MRTQVLLLEAVVVALLLFYLLLLLQPLHQDIGPVIRLLATLDNEQVARLLD